MGWTKRQIIDEAFSELALQGYEFDITPEEQQTALRRLDTMMATWDGLGIRVGYLLPSSPDESNIDADSGLPDYAVETTYLHLAMRIAAGFGKQLSADTKRSASEGYKALMARAAMPRQQQFSGTLPVGAGNRSFPTRGPFYPPPCDSPFQVDQGGDLDISED